MTAIDYSSADGQLQLRERINSELRILAGVRAQALAGCYTVLPASKSLLSKSLNIGTLEMSKVSGRLADINQSEITVGATYLAKEEYAEEVIFPGAMLRYAERDPVPKASTRLMEADDYLMDKTLIDALVGPMMVGDSLKPTLDANVPTIVHGGLGLTPDKITTAATLIRRFMPSARLMMPITVDMHRQLTAFDAFINNDLLLQGQRSAYSGKVLDSKWYDVGFKMTPDFVREDATTQERTLLPVIKSEPYIPASTWDGKSWVRHVPIYATESVDFEEMMSPQVEIFDIWKQRKKPKGTLAARIDHEMGFARNNRYGVAIIQVIEVNEHLTVNG
ncbi:MAG: hypothetical protein AAFQ58_19220 [Pseudomonadota bacterium]